MSPFPFKPLGIVTGAPPNQKYVVSLYLALLDRQPSSSEIASTVNSLNSGVPRATVVQTIMSSSEYAQDIVDQLYVTYLGRHASPAERNQWANQLKAGTPVSALVASILSSPEYFARATS
jgi:Domain of unknown function (DUF4214)